MAKKKRRIRDTWIGVGGVIVAALIGVVGTVLASRPGNSSSGGQSPSAKTVACGAAHKAVLDEINGLKALWASLDVKDVGTANAIATRIHRKAWNKAEGAESSSSDEVHAAIAQLGEAGVSVDPAVEGRLHDLIGIIGRLPGEIPTRSRPDGADTRQLSDSLAHFQNDISPKICSGTTIPNA
jgi:hypothetical protein